MHREKKVGNPAIQIYSLVIWIPVHLVQEHGAA